MNTFSQDFMLTKIVLKLTQYLEDTEKKMQRVMMMLLLKLFRGWSGTSGQHRRGARGRWARPDLRNEPCRLTGDMQER